MELEKTINSDIKQAMLAKDSKKLQALRAVKAAILLAKTDKRASGDLSEDVEMKILQRLVKQRKESAEVYNSQNRDDLAEEELFQATVIENYLPEQMSEAGVRDIVHKIIDETGASGMRDMGKVMGMATRQLAGKADNRLISSIVKEILNA